MFSHFHRFNYEIFIFFHSNMSSKIVLLAFGIHVVCCWAQCNNTHKNCDVDHSKRDYDFLCNKRLQKYLFPVSMFEIWFKQRTTIFLVFLLLNDANEAFELSRSPFLKIQCKIKEHLFQKSEFRVQRLWMLSSEWQNITCLKSIL